MPIGTERLFIDVDDEIARQDTTHPAGYPATRDGVFLGIMTAVHELQSEALGSWRAERSECRGPEGEAHYHWPYTRAELVQAAAIILRTIRSIDLNLTG